MRQRLQKISKYSPSIFQGKLDFAAPAGVSLTVEHPTEQIIFRTLLILLCAFACTYVYFVGATVLNVIARKDALSQTIALRSSVSKLEGNYYQASADIGPQSGERLGLSGAPATAFVYRPGPAAAATMVRNEI